MWLMCGLSLQSNNQTTTTEVKLTTSWRMWLLTVSTFTDLKNIQKSTLSFKLTPKTRQFMASLLLTFTFLRDLVELVPSGAFTFKRSNSVDTISALTDARDGLALIHICTCISQNEYSNGETAKGHRRYCGKINLEEEQEVNTHADRV